MTTKTNEDWKYTLGGLLADGGISPSQYKIESKIWDCVYEAIKQETALAVEKERESKDEAYRERNMLVCALTKLFPAYLARHDENDTTWEKDWMWIVYIDLPTGQVSWHIHDSERLKFSHLELKENKWDGHNTERKYQRLQALQILSPHSDTLEHNEKDRI